MAATGADRALRIISIGSFVPAFAFLMAHSVITQSPFPGFALIPLGLSSLYGLLLVWRNHFERLSEATILDFFLGIFLVGMTVPGIVKVRGANYNWRCRDCTEETMIGTLGIVCCLINICIHLYFVLTGANPCRQLRSLFRSPYCPHCNSGFVFQWQLPGTPSSNSSAHSKEYVQVPDEVEGRLSVSKEPRPSTEDESASLV